MGKHPNKLKEDAIVESLCDIRFSASSDVPEEVILGWLIDSVPWKGWSMRRLPSSDIPAVIRRSEEQLRFQPSVELRNPDNARIVRIGSNILTLHFTGPYPGWDALRPKLAEAVELLFVRVPSISISRLALRYINAFEESRHKVNSVYELDLAVTIGDRRLDAPLNLNFMEIPTRFHTVMTRIASVEFVKGNLSKNVSAVADIDVFSCSDFSAENASDVMSWMDEAHDLEKDAFFTLLPDKVAQELKEN